LRRAVVLPDGTVELLLVLLNADSAEQDFLLPEPKVNWTMLLDSARTEAPEWPLGDGHALLAAYSVMLLKALLP
jgi:isoamylase